MMGKKYFINNCVLMCQRFQYPIISVDNEIEVEICKRHTLKLGLVYLVYKFILVY